MQECLLTVNFGRPVVDFQIVFYLFIFLYLYIFPIAIEGSVVCTETASSSGSQRSCAVIGQSQEEGAGSPSI